MERLGELFVQPPAGLSPEQWALLNQQWQASSAPTGQQWASTPPPEAPPPMEAPAPKPSGLAALGDIAQRWLIDPAKSAVNEVRNSPWLYPSNDTPPSPFPEAPLGDQFEIAARRVQQAAHPAGGRIEGTLSDRPDAGLVVPRSPLDIGTLATMLPLPLPAKAAALGLSAALEPSEAWAGKLDALRAGVRGVKAAVPAEMRAGASALPSTGARFAPDASVAERLAGPQFPKHVGEINPNSKVNLGTVFRGTEGTATTEAAANRAGLGDLGNGVYVTHNQDIAGSYGGGPTAKLSDGTRKVHSFDAGSLYPEEVAYVFGGAKVGEPVQIVSGNGIPLWSGEWSGANIENALKDSGVRAVIGTPNSIGINQVAIRDPALLKPASATGARFAPEASVAEQLSDTARRSIGGNMPPPEFAITPEDMATFNPLPRAKPAASSMDLPNLRELSTADAIALARNQPHLIKSGEGGEGLYVGGPRDVQSKAALNKIRSDFDKYIAADPRGGDWYDRYRTGMNEVTGGDALANKWMSAQEGQWSAGVDPGSELHFSLKENNAALAGMPVKAARPAQHLAHLNAIAAKDPGLYQLGEKTGEYASKVSPDQARPPGATGVNDFRHARNFHYTEPSGEPQKGAVGKAGHKFLDYETALAVDRANQTMLGGRDDWTGEKLQAAPWVRQKALDIMSRNKALTYEEAFDRANKTIADYFNRHTAFATHEAQPGADVTGHMPQSAAAEQSVKDAYANDPRSSWATAPGGRDAIYGGMSIPDTGVAMRVRPTKPMQGLYVNPAGKVETNQGEVARPLVTFDTGGKGEPFKTTTAHDKALLDVGEALRGYVDAQNASAWHKPWLGGPANQSTSLFFPRSGKASTAELLALRTKAAEHGLNDIVDTGQGITATNFYGGQPEPSKAFDKALRKGEFEQFGTPVRSKVGPGDSGYIDYVDKWKQGVGSDAATKELLTYVNRTPEIRAALNNNPYLGDRAMARMQRDEDWAAQWGAPREDIQYARKLIGDGPGWVDRLEAAIGKGLLPALAGAALLGAGAMGQRQQEGQDAQL